MTQEKQNGVARWLRHHNRLLSVLGALIAFLTFILKEGFRDYLKDLAGSIGSSQLALSTRSDINLAQRNIDVVLVGISNRGDYIGATPDLQKQERRIVKDGLFNTWDFEQMTRDLVEKLP